MAIYKLSDGRQIIADADFIAANFTDAVYVGEQVANLAGESFIISKLSFISRVGHEFWLDVEDAAAAGDRNFRKMVLMFNNASYIDLTDQRITSGIQATLNPALPVGLQKTQAEVDAILLTPCQPGEGP